MSSTGKSGRRVSTAMYRGGNVIGRGAIARDCGGGAKGRGTGSGATGRDGGGGANSHGDGERILKENKKVKHVMETYHKKVVEYSEEGVEKTENDIFFEVIGGHNKGFMSGLGESAELFYGRRVKSSKVSCTPSLISQIQHYRNEATQAKQKLEEQDAKMHDQETKIKDQANKILDQDKKLEEFEKRLHELSTLINERCSSTSTSVHRHFPPHDSSSGTFGNFVA
ncbi:hypothetical protein RND81_02G203200 [Saponaria officinalis]|uniref:Uncharacterized protein n=1 Tax=Saponaria officinalis TaxID=3572 RepID=A0AAW1MX17_SAPOF